MIAAQANDSIRRSLAARGGETPAAWTDHAGFDPALERALAAHAERFAGTRLDPCPPGLEGAYCVASTPDLTNPQTGSRVRYTLLITPARAGAPVTFHAVETRGRDDDFHNEPVTSRPVLADVLAEINGTFGRLAAGSGPLQAPVKWVTGTDALSARMLRERIARMTGGRPRPRPSLPVMTVTARTRAEEIRSAIRDRGSAEAPVWGADTDGMHQVAPIAPDGKRECWAVKRPGAVAWEWLAGWIGSPLTISIDLHTGRFLWTRHTPSLQTGDRPLTREMLGHSHRPFAELPADVRALIKTAVTAGPDELTGSSNEQPLAPY